jgi:hypothetical protein
MPRDRIGDEVGWCHDCEVVVRGATCPVCHDSFGVWSYYRDHEGSDWPPAHWPKEAPEDGTRLDLYE